MTNQEAIDSINAIRVQTINDGNTIWTEACQMAIVALMKQHQPDSEETDGLEKELKPCPFCGGEAHIMRLGYPHYIYCEDCGAKIHGGQIGDGAEEASIKAWNRRRLPATKIFPQAKEEDIFRAAAKSKELGDYIRGLFEEVWEAHQKREEKKQ